ncbi:ABC-F family ATP-binding cassette domain-containing protein [Oceanispirochaeta sp.]|jgi:ATP-binding cassette subfamily F protein 3|uniref:ABC-F family ATP-binding cassette domain-containing protein n=1 Tax=Oceanispirochaeta sp. TaxID=2035350 RepID=UPI002611EB8D|nr:ABC-F family ATP-binding cassette domain-containing protein [Oceanispirochaeta sp.]MDA3957483.1 ABC-F family ATP-binding cassette domain-containing protein [Oceanispirochaeta sp.]
MVNLSNIRIAYGERILFQNSSVLIRPLDKIGLVGPNGSGKTTIFRLITGEEHPDDGTVTIDPGVVVGYFSQDVGEMAGRSALQEVLEGAGKVHELSLQMEEMEHTMADGEAMEKMSDEDMDKFMNRYGEVQMEYQNRGGYELENNAKAILDGLGIAESRQSQSLENFSGGWKMRIALARILLLNPDVLLMDEPTNHLDIESIIWLEEWLKSFKGALMMTSHDREFMTRICGRTVEAAAESINSYTGNYDFYLREREIRREHLVAANRRQQAMLAKEEEFIARFAARASHAAQVQSRVKMIEKMERVVIPPDPKVMKFNFPPCPRSGDVVVRMENLAKSWPLEDGTIHPVFSGISGVVERGNKIALTGINGAGKSTLLKVLASLTESSHGSCELGASVNAGYFSQYSGDSLNMESTIFEELSELLPKESVGAIKNLLGAFQFSGDDTEKKIRILSGGEKSRVMLASLLARPLNFLMLDEPTNHLDIASREVLLEALQKFEGTLIIVSHDRYFLKHLVNRVFEIDHGIMKTFEGDYSYYLGKKEKN